MTLAEALDSVPAKPPLSNQEALVVRYLVHGLTYVSLAAVMGISVRTAKQYSARARVKIGVSSSREIVQLVIAIMTSHSDDCTT